MRMSMYLPSCALVPHDISCLIIFDAMEFTMQLKDENKVPGAKILLSYLQIDLFLLSSENKI